MLGLEGKSEIKLSKNKVHCFSVFSMLSSALLDIDDLRDEVQDADFNADEYLESYIQRNMGVFPGSSSSQLMDLDIRRGNKIPTSLPSSPTGPTVNSKNSLFDPERLLQSFNDLFETLVHINNQYSSKYNQALLDLENKEAKAMELISGRLEKAETSSAKVQLLESDLTDLARKIYYLCDNIYTVSEPQERLKDTRKLLTHFMELNQDITGDYTFPELTRSRKTIDDFKEASSTLLRLHRIAKDMGTTEDKIYSKARDRIFDLYNQLQNDLVRLFSAAHCERPMDITTMQQTAEILQNFPFGYQQCVVEFIQRSATMSPGAMRDIFNSIVQLCDSTYKIVNDIFPAPDAIMEKFIAYVITEKLQLYVKDKLDVKNSDGQEAYLRDLYDLHKKTKGLEQSLGQFKQLRLEKVTATIFSLHLANYVYTETNFLKNRCTGMIQQYYDAMFNEWNLIRPGPVQILQEKKDFFNVSIITSKTIPSVVGEFLKDHPSLRVDYKLISESLALNLLHELRQSASRAQALAPEEQLGNCLLALGRCIVDHVLLIHMDYGLEIGLSTLPPVEPKAEPDLGFLTLAHLSTVLYNLTVQQLNESLKSLPRFTSQNQKLKEQLREAKERLERKSNMGLEHCLNCAMNWVHNLLQQQRRTEYAETRHNFSTTNTARKVAQYFSKTVQLVETSVDGENCGNVFMELGFRFHREIYDRLIELPYTSDGVMVLICDVNEYRECVRLMKKDIIVVMFDQLLALCNLLLAQPSNLPLMCDNIFSVLEQKEPIAAFIRLRSDFRTAGDFVRSYL